MKLPYFLLFLVLSLLVACGSAPRPQGVESEVQALPAATDQPGSLPAPETVTGEGSSPVANPANMTVEDPPNSPVATPLPEADPSSGVAEPDGREAVFPNPIIVYRQEGRFPGSPQQWTIYQTGRIVTSDGTEWQIPAEQAKLLFDLIGSADFWQQSNNFAPAGECRDCLIHTLTIYREGEIKEITITNQPEDLPPDLSQMLEQLDRLVSP